MGFPTIPLYYLLIVSLSFGSLGMFRPDEGSMLRGGAGLHGGDF